MSTKRILACTFTLALALVVASCGDETTTAPVEIEAPLSPPQNIVASQLDNGFVVISWDPSTEPSLVGYNVYRMEVGSSSIQKLNGSAITSNHYMDDAAGIAHTYEYRVTAVGAGGKESAFVTATIEVMKPSTGDRNRPNEL